MQMIRYVFTLTCLLALQACMALGPRFERASAGDGNETVVYVYRPANFTNSAITPDLCVNETLVAELTNGGYAAVRVKKGINAVRLGLPGWKGSAEQIDSSTGGDELFYRVDTTYTVVYPMGTRTFLLKRVPASAALSEIAETKQVPVKNAKQ
jgi:hypothetical protein